MTVEEEVDGALSLHESCRKTKTEQPSHLKRWHWMVLCLVCLSLGAVLVLPAIDKRWVESFFGAEEETVSSTGDEPLNGSAYNYWYAPENSFGIQQTKNVNFTFWKKWLKQYFSYELEARPNNESEWQNANELLNVSLVFNEINNTCKVSLVLNTSQAPKSLYYRFTLVANRSVISHINKSVSYQYTINLSANATENYSLVYNYSDLTPYIDSGKITIKQGIYNNYFYQRIKTNKKIAVNRTFEIDPTFGEIYAYASVHTILDYLKSGYHQAPASGTVDNITYYLGAWDGGDKVKYFIQNSTGHLMAETPEDNSGGANGWHTFEFSAPKPTIVNGDYYFIGATSSLYVEGMRVTKTGGHYRFSADEYDDGIADPASYTSSNYNLSCYASYTVSAAEQWNDIGSMDFNVSFSNTTVNRDVGNMDFNVSMGNTTVNRDVDSMDFNISFGNLTVNRDIGNLDYNISFGNISTSSQVFLFNISFGNDTVDEDIGNMDYNISFGNLSVRVYQNIGSMDYNISFGNLTTDKDIGSMDYNISFGNSSIPLAWYPIGNMYFNISFSNSSPPTLNITIEYPSNNSNIQDTQPMLYFNLTSPQGYTMNYSIYIGNGSGNCTTLIHSEVNVSSGTQRGSEHFYYNAIEHYEEYYWRIQANDGYSYINETYNFKSILQGGGVSRGIGIIVALSLFGGLSGTILGGILLVKKRRRGR